MPLGQSWPELKIADPKYTDHIKDTVTQSIKAGYSVSVRANPAEDLSKYQNLDVILDTDYSLPLELLFDYPYIVMGFNSAATINSSGIFGAPTYRLKCDYLGQIKFSNKQLEKLNQYCESEKTVFGIILELKSPKYPIYILF